MDLFELDFFRDWDLDQPCHVESERSALKRREWERRTQEVQQDDDLFSSDFNLFGEPYKTSRGDALTSRVQNTLGSYEEMKDLLTNQTNQSHLVGIPKGNGTSNLPTPTSTAPDRPALEQDTSTTDRKPTTNPSHPAGSKKSRSHGGGGRAPGSREEPKHSSRGGRGSEEQPSRGGRAFTQEEQPKQPEKSRSSERRSVMEEQPGRGGRVTEEQLKQQEKLRAGAERRCVTEEQPERGGRTGTMEQQLLKQEDLREELSSTKGDSSPASLTAPCGGRRLNKRQPDAVPFRSSSVDVGHFKSSCETKTPPLENGSPLASTSLLTTPTQQMTMPTTGLTTPTFPGGGLSLKPAAVMQKPTAYVRPMDGQDQNPSSSPQLKPPLLGTEGYSGGQCYGNHGNAKNKLPKLSLAHNTEVGLQSDPSCVEEILREMTHSWPPPLTAIHTPLKSDQTKFPIPNNKEPLVFSSSFSVQKRCSVAANKPTTKAPQKSMLEDDLKISSDEDEPEVSEKNKARTSALSGGSGSSSESESSSESDTDESESSSSDTATPEPEPPSSNKWQLDSWLKVQAQPRPAAPPQEEPHTAGSAPQTTEPFSPEAEAQTLGSSVKTKPCGASTPGASAEEHKDRTLSSSVRDKGKSRLGLKGAVEAQRKVRLSPGFVPGSESSTPKRATTGRKQPCHYESTPAGEEQERSWSRPSPNSSVSRDKDLAYSRPPEHHAPQKPRCRTPGGKTAPRKEPRTTANNANAANANNASSANAALQATPFTPVSSASKEQRKHRGPSCKTTPKSREFIETDSSTSSSESQSDSEENCPKARPAPPQRALPAQVHVPCTITTSGGKGLRAKDNGVANGISSNSNRNATEHNLQQLGVSDIGESFGISVPDPGGPPACQNMDQFSPDVMASEIPLSPLRAYEEIRTLWVKINLGLLSRIPGVERIQNGGFAESRKHEDWESERGRQVFVKMESEREEEEEEEERSKVEESANEGRARDRGTKSKHSRRQTNGTNQKHKSKRKHKSDHSDITCCKKLRLETLLPPCISPIHSHRNDSVSRKPSHPRDEKLLPPLLSPLADEPPPRASPGDESGSAPGPGPGLNPSPVQEVSHRHRRDRDTADLEVAERPTPVRSDSETWIQTRTERDPVRPRLSFSDSLHGADFHMQEAKRLKHKADKLSDKFGKAVNYADGALSFIECGTAMERDPLEAKSPYTMYSETVELIRYAMRLKNFSSHSSSTNEKKLSVLCNRCLSLLYLRMFQLKKEHAVKYSRSLLDYFKSSAKSSSQQQAPSPWRNNSRANGAPSPLALSPSPAGHGALPTVMAAGGGASSSSSSSSVTVTIPQKIHHMASSHVSITNHILRSYAHWENAERLSRDCPEFLEELDSALEPLTQQSTMSSLVRYVRQGLHWIRIDANLV